MEKQITNKEILKKLNQIQIDINIIKEKLDDDGELSDWAKEELAKSRAEPVKNYTSLDKLRKEIENEL